MSFVQSSTDWDSFSFGRNLHFRKPLEALLSERISCGLCVLRLHLSAVSSIRKIRPTVGAVVFVFALLENVFFPICFFVAFILGVQLMVFGCQLLAVSDKISINYQLSTNNSQLFLSFRSHYAFKFILYCIFLDLRCGNFGGC